MRVMCLIGLCAALPFASTGCQPHGARDTNPPTVAHATRQPATSSAAQPIVPGASVPLIQVVNQYYVEKQRWPDNKTDLERFAADRRISVDLGIYERIDFTQLTDGSVEMRALIASASLGNMRDMKVPVTMRLQPPRERREGATSQAATTEPATTSQVGTGPVDAALLYWAAIGRWPGSKAQIAQFLQEEGLPALPDGIEDVSFELLAAGRVRMHLRLAPHWSGSSYYGTTIGQLEFDTDRALPVARQELQRLRAERAASRPAQ